MPLVAIFGGAWELDPAKADEAKRTARDIFNIRNWLGLGIGLGIQVGRIGDRGRAKLIA